MIESNLYYGKSVEGNIMFDKLSLDVLEKYKNKLNDSLENKNNTDINLYFHECMQKSIERVEVLQLNTKDEVINMLNSLDNDMLSILYCMCDGITLNGCKELLTVCCQYIALINGTPYEIDAMSVVHAQIYKGFQTINENYANTFIKYKEDVLIEENNDLSMRRDIINQYSTSHYFYQLDFFINLYHVYGSKLAIGSLHLISQSISEDLINNGNLVIIYNLKEVFFDRSEKYVKYTADLNKDNWTPPELKFPTSYQVHFKNSDNGACYIATAVYGGYDTEEVLTLRLFRDNTLNKTTYGKKIITFYYKNSPKLVERYKDNDLLKLITKIIINKFIFILRKLDMN